MVSLAGAVVVALVATLGLLYYKRESCRTSRYGRAPTRDTTHPGQGSVNVENGTAGTHLPFKSTTPSLTLRAPLSTAVALLRFY